MAYTIEQHQQALEKAKAAGDAASVAVISQRIKDLQATQQSGGSSDPIASKHLAAFDKASNASDIDSADVIAQRYRAARPTWSREAALKDPMWVHNARTLYKDANGQDFKGKDEEAAQWLENYMSDFNYRVAGIGVDNARGTADIALSIKNFSPQGKAAFLASMDDFDALPMSLQGTGEMGKRVLTDPTTYIGIGTGGVGTAVAQGGKAAAKEGLKEAIKFGAKQVAKAGAIGAAEGAAYGAGTDALRQTAEIGAGRKDQYDTGEIGKSAVLGAGIGGVGGAVVRGVIDSPTILKGANRLKVDNNAAAGRLAERFQRLQDTQGFNLGETNDITDKGAKQAIGTAHSEIAQEVNDQARLLRDSLDPLQATGRADRDARLLAQQALRSARTKEKAYTSSDRIDAVQKLVGSTQEGARLVDLLKERNELYRVTNRGLRGGVSRVTEKFNPFARPGRFSDSGLAYLPAVAGHLYGGLHTAGQSLLAQGAVVGGGRLIDKLTGRSSLPRLFMKQNLGRAAEGDLGGRLPSVLDANNAELAAQNEAKQFKDNLKRLAANASFQARMDKQLQQQTNQLVRTRTGIGKQFNSEQAKAAKAEQVAVGQKLKEQMQWQKERTRLLNAEQKAKTAADRQKVVDQRRQLDLVYKQMRVQQALEKQQAQQIINAIGGPAALKKAMKPLGQTLSEKAGPKPKSAAPKPKANGGDDNPIRNQQRWEYRKNQIIQMEKDAREAATSAPNDTIKRAINRAVDAFQRVKNSHSQRMEAYEAARDKATNNTELQYIEDSLDALARVFERKTKKKT